MVSDQPLLLLSTLNGSLIAVDKLTGTELWALDEGEVIVSCMTVHTYMLDYLLDYVHVIQGLSILRIII